MGRQTYVRMSATMVALLLSGCGGAQEPATETVTQTVTEEAAQTVTTQGPSPDVTETATESPTTSTAPTTDDEADETTTDDLDGPTSSDDDQDEGEAAGEYDFGDPVTNERGNLVKKVGQWAGLGSSVDDVYAVFRVTEIERDFECTEEWAEAPANGEFIALTFEIETMPELADQEPPILWFDAYNMSIFDEDNNRENDSMGNAFMCLPQSQLLPSEIGPGEKVKGKVVLDTAVESGSITFDGRVFGTEGSWAWEF